MVNCARVENWRIPCLIEFVEPLRLRQKQPNRQYILWFKKSKRSVTGGS